MNLQNILDQALPIVRNAGEVIRTNWKKPRQIRHKGVVDLVTETDVAVEQALKRDLAEILPEALFVGEESTDPANPAVPDALCWVVDPVDGTTNFVHRIPLVAISVALCQHKRPVVGIVLAPMLDQCFYATVESSAFCNGEKIGTSPEETLQQALAVTGFPYSMAKGFSTLMQNLERVLPATQGLRRFGSAAIDLAWVAAGMTDVFYEGGLKPWDMAAGWLLVERAGGKVTQFSGAPVAFHTTLLATNGHVHGEMVRLLSE